jgi:hypothetical protein
VLPVLVVVLVATHSEVMDQQVQVAVELLEFLEL